MFGRKKPRKNELETRFSEEAMIHADALFGAAMRMTKSRRDAEDLVQDTLMKAFQHFHKYQQGTNCKAWLFKILTNTFINRYRKKQRDRVFLIDDTNSRPLAERIAVRPSSELETRKETPKQNISRLFGDEVGVALRNVPVDFRMAVMLSDVYEFSYKECAEILDVPIGTVMSRLYRGRRLLRAQLAEYAVETGAVRALTDNYSDQIDKDRSKTVNLADVRAARA
ncbi:MAG: RNA polymerase sigma-70 factor (ECF subfamily) [Bradymonadia bacterium]|jgi:RNA polymerase sigma-70 factor (ECF subfamily)